ncbi:MAG: outer membrane protein assembly factor BamB [Gammaproteobacteria bacterium]|nr:outer membrane protein assembly factor BamB [Gammaproteobacteria bacterium]MDH5593259.1 outer membrane protein assembly factor BamB [Gammaproteobacteria bacterium]
MIIRAFVILVMAYSLSACSWFGWGKEDTTEPPAELVDFDEKIRINELWSNSTGSGAEELYLKLKPGIDGERVFATNHEGDVYAFHAKTGEKLWEAELEKRVSGGTGVGEYKVFVGTSDAEVIALDQSDGKVSWIARVSSEVLSAPVASNGIVVIRTGDGKLFGLNATTGKRLWIYDRTIPVLTLRGTSSPVVVNNMVLAGFANGKLVSLNLASGKQIWETTIAAPRGRSELERMVDIDADPVVIGNLVYVVTFQGFMSVIDLHTGQILWTRKMSSSAGINVDRSNMYVSDSDGHIWAFTRDSGRGLWKQEMLHARQISAPVVQGDYVVVGDLEGYLHWISREDGSFVARERADSAPIIAAPVVADDILYVVSKEGDLAAYRIER